MALRFSSDTSTTWVYEVRGDSMLLSQYKIYDGFDYLYRKINPN